MPPPTLHSIVRAFHDLAMQSQYWPLEQLLARQRKELTQLLRHARHEAPFYASRLDAALRPDGEVDWDRWREIPIITRQDLIENFDAMQARQTPPLHGGRWPKQSSGSTGQPVKITYNELFAATNLPFNWRAQSWQGCDWSRPLVTMTQKFDLKDRDAMDLGPWGPPWDPVARQGHNIDLGNKTKPEAALRFLAKMPRPILENGGNTVHLYAMEARRLGIEVGLAAAFSHGEAITEEGRLACSSVFGAPFYERYSSREAGRMAHACTHQTGMHVNMEKVLVEILDEDGAPCPEGVPGRVVVTPFYNTANPLIRYEQGDIAMWGPPCTCGRTLPVIQKVLGRMSAIFRHPSGAATHAFYPQRAREALACGLWQIAQVGPLDFEVRYVPNDWAVPADEAKAAEIFREVYFADARVAFVRTKTLRATAAQKYLEYVYEVKAAE